MLYWAFFVTFGLSQELCYANGLLGVASRFFI